MRILMSGESWMINTNHIKGVDMFVANSYDESNVDIFRAMFEKAGFCFDFIPSHLAISQFPGREGLKNYDVVILSDIGSDTLLLHPDATVRFRACENRLDALVQFVEEGGGLIMFGGWNSFCGQRGIARYNRSSLAQVLPVTMYDFDDRVEAPQGVQPEITREGHPIFQGVDTHLPAFLGYNQLKPREGAEVLGWFGQDVFIACAEYGKGRSIAYASDITTHWATPEWVESSNYERLVLNMMCWLAGKATGETR